MKTLRRFLEHTIIGGMFFLLPFVVLLMVGQKIWAVFHDLGGNFAEWLGFGHLLNASSESALSAFGIVLTCFLFGLLARWSLASNVRNRFESSLRNALPPYEYHKAIVEQKLALNDKPPRPTVLVRRPGGWQPGILVEEFASGERVVFFPFSPKTTDGEVYLVSPEDVRPSTMDERTLNKILRKQGKGLVPQESAQ